MSDPLLVTVLLAAATFSTRFLGVVLGQHLPDKGPLARTLTALPGCLIASLVTVMLIGAGPNEWIGASIALAIAVVTRNLPLTMIVGIAAVWVLRSYF